jgi:hypothetical protein
MSSCATVVNRAPTSFRRLDIGLVELGTEIGSGHAVDRVRQRASVTFVDIVGGERRAERAAGIARGRLNPDIAEAAFAQHLAVGDTVERHAAGKTQVLDPGLGREAAGEAQNDVF